MLARLVVILAVLANALSASASEPITLKVSLGSIAKGVKLGTVALSLDGVVRGILPAVLLTKSSPGVRIAVFGDDLGFNGVLKQSPDGVTIEPEANTHCLPYDAKWSVVRTGQTIAVTMSVAKVGNWGCVDAPSVGAPDGKGKVQFSSVPEGATLYYPKHSGAGFVVKRTPSTLVVDFTARGQMGIVFKKAGYYDCSRLIQFSQKEGAYLLSVDGVAAGTTTSNTAVAPKVTCTLVPLTGDE